MLAPACAPLLRWATPSPISRLRPEGRCGELKEPAQRHFVVEHRLGQRRLQVEAAVQRSETLGGDTKNLSHKYHEKAETLLLDEAQVIFSNVGALARLETSFDSFELGVITREEELIRRKRRGASALAYSGSVPVSGA
jgi:hypothetical protein